MDPNISIRSTQSVQVEVSAQQPLPPKKSNKKIVFWTFAILLFLIAFVVGGFFTGAKQNKLNQQTAIRPTIVQPSPTPTVVNLNPNTGNLYNDIQIRLNQVIK